jgi:pimeloyl-ACP methyl ester carboxylesterase
MIPLIHSFIGEVLAERFPGASGVVIIGHSIGGAVALSLAAADCDWQLRGVAVSGIGDAPSAIIKAWHCDASPTSFPPPESSASLFLGPEGTYGWQAPIALRRSSEPWRAAEVREVVREWPSRWERLSASIRVPVHLRLAEHDNIWETGQLVVDRMSRAMKRAPLIDGAVLQAGGHLYEIHKRGPELIASQLDFLETAGESA